MVKKHLARIVFSVPKNTKFGQYLNDPLETSLMEIEVFVLSIETREKDRELCVYTYAEKESEARDVFKKSKRIVSDYLKQTFTDRIFNPVTLTLLDDMNPR